MATTLQVVASDLSTILADLNDPIGANNGNLGGVRTEVALGGALDMGPDAAEQILIESPAVDGGEIVRQRHGLSTVAWSQVLRAPSGATTPDVLFDAVGELGRLFDRGGVLKWIRNNSTQVRYIDFEPSPTPALLQGIPSELQHVTGYFETPNGVGLRLFRQPFLRAAELAPAVNLATNPTLTHDFGGTSNRPDGWTWDSTTGISAESIVKVDVGGVRRGAYQFTIADGGVHNLQQTTAASSVASGQVAPFSYWARVVAVAGTPRVQAMVEYMDAAGTGQIGADQTGGLVTLTTAWQRITVTPAAAGASTSRVRVSLQVDNNDATSVTIQLCNAQPEVGSAPTPFRVPGAAVAYNPTSTSLPRKIAIWGEGNAPSLGKLKITADALTLGRYHVYKVSERAIDILKATLHKSLRSGTLGSDTTSVADSDGIDGNVAQVAYVETDPAFGTDAGSAGNSTTTITVTKPTSLAVGDCMLAWIAYWRFSGQIIAPEGWQLVGIQPWNGGGQNDQKSLHVWVKIADADDVAATDFTFTIAYQSSGGLTAAYIAWIGRFTDVDQTDPVDVARFNIESSPTNLPTLSTISPTADDAMIVGIVAGSDDASVGSLSYTAPSGTGPTYTEQHDAQSPAETHRAASCVTGLLATAGATGDRDFTASLTGYFITCHLALRKAAAVLEPRSTVTFSGSGAGALPPGEYDVWLRYRTTAACWDRLRVEYALKASPSTWIALADVLIDTRSASTFTEYQEHLMGRLAIPEEVPLDTLTVRVSAGREISSSANMRLDAIYLAPAFERRATLRSPTVLASGEHLSTDPSISGVVHLASDSDLAEVAQCDGPTPQELDPGYQVLVVWPQLNPLSGFSDPATEVTSAPTLAVTGTPRYRA